MFTPIWLVSFSVWVKSKEARTDWFASSLLGEGFTSSMRRPDR